MIRFCNIKVYWIQYCTISDQYTLSRAELLSYFEDGHQDDIVCVRDNGTMKFRGIITYQSLNRFATVTEAVRTEYLIFDKNIWNDARKYCSRHPYSGTKYPIPVLDIYNQLFCFAYEDIDANCEIRMLRELSELPNAIQFTDMYPEYKCVKIYGFNELAYFTAKYLEWLGIAVEAIGEMWSVFFTSQKCAVSNYECLTIYAEGIDTKKRNWKENLLRSVSVEFECIDKIYEENIKNEFIRDAEYGSIEFLKYLKDKEIILMDIGKEGQAIYDFLFGEGIDICGFIDGNGDKQHRLFGKKIVSRQDAIKEYCNSIFIDCLTQNSAWGFGEVDYYDYLGYRRNMNYFCIRDYIDISESCLLNVLKQWRIVLLGDIYLCKYLNDFFHSKKIQVFGYIEIGDQDDNWEVRKVEKENIVDDVLCLYAIPELAANASIEMREKICLYLKENELYNYSDYFSYTNSYINIEQIKNMRITKKQLMPKRIVLGSIEDSSGNMFFKGLLDGHPEILSTNFAELNNNMFWYCIRLSMEGAEDILSIFWRMYKAGGGNDIYNTAAFNEKMKQLLGCDTKFTPLELFVMIFISFSNMYKKNIEISENIIYWEPHCLDRKMSDEYIRWLGMLDIPCDIISIVRNACMTTGSRIKNVRLLGFRGYTSANAYIGAFVYGLCGFPSAEKQNYKCSDRLIVKFEDLKCNPRETLLKLCDRWKIKWSDSLTHVTRNGEKRTYFNGEKKISDFDLEPVYNTYEEYFSEYDRFRVMFLNSLWQKRYDYPYVDLQQFTQREVQEMWLKKFRFENLLDMSAAGIEFKIEIQRILKRQFKKMRMTEFHSLNQKGLMGREK